MRRICTDIPFLLRCLREEAGLSYRQLERLSGISRSTLQRMEGALLSPRVDDLLYLLGILAIETGRDEEELRSLPISINIDHLLQDTVEIEVLGAPVAKGRPQVTRRGTYTPKRTKEALRVWERACIGKTPFPVDTALHADLLFLFPRPKRLQKRSSPQGRILHTVRPDTDNLCKLVFDGIERGGLIKCDSRIAEISCKKVYAAALPSGGWEAPKTVLRLSIIGSMLYNMPSPLGDPCTL